MNKVLICWDTNCCLSSHLSHYLPILRRSCHTKRTLLAKVYVKKDTEFTIIPPSPLQPNHHNNNNSDVHKRNKNKYNHHNNNSNHSTSTTDNNNHNPHQQNGFKQNGLKHSGPNGYTHNLPTDSPPTPPSSNTCSITSTLSNPPSNTPPSTSISSSPPLESNLNTPISSHTLNTLPTPTPIQEKVHVNLNNTSPQPNHKPKNKNKNKKKHKLKDNLNNTNNIQNLNSTDTLNPNNITPTDLNNNLPLGNQPQQYIDYNASPEFYPLEHDPYYYYYYYYYSNPEAFYATSSLPPDPNFPTNELNTTLSSPSSPSSSSSSSSSPSSQKQFPLPYQPYRKSSPTNSNLNSNSPFIKVKPPPSSPSPSSPSPSPSSASPPPSRILELTKLPSSISVAGFNEKITTALQANHLKSCLELFSLMKAHKVQPNTQTYELLISAYIGTPAARNANLLFSELIHNNVAPSAAIYEKLIVINAKHPSFCDQIYAHMRNNAAIAPDSCVARALILAHANHSRDSAQKLRRAREILHDLVVNKTEGVILPADVFNLVMELVSEDEASELYASMGAHGVRPDVTTFNTLLSKNHGKGEGKRIREEMILAEMKVQEIPFNLITYNALIASAAIRRELGRAKELHEEMKEKGMEADIVTYQQLTVFAAKMGEHDYCWQLLQEMKSKGWS